MRPTSRALFVLLGFFTWALAAAFFPALQTGFVHALVGFGLLLGGDLVFAFSSRKLRFERDGAARLALGEESQVTLTLHNDAKRSLRARLYDALPGAVEVERRTFPQRVVVKGGQFARYTYTLKPRQRGRASFGQAYLEIHSLLGLWWRAHRVGEESTVQIYPNYQPALTYGLLATANRLEQMGLQKPNRRGMSREFHQLRDYQDGDSLSAIDWKASSRVNRLISRETQEEKDQHILFVIDTSLRTRAKDGELPILDHLLNTVILLSHIALGQGDKVSLMNFGGEHRYLERAKGANGMGQVLNHLYDYRSHHHYGEYEELTAHIETLKVKRSLIVILTNQRSEDQLSAAEAFGKLSARHLVLVASVKEYSLVKLMTQDVLTEEEEAASLGALAYEMDFDNAQQKLAQRRLHLLRASVAEFPVKLANLYLDLRPQL